MGECTKKNDDIKMGKKLRYCTFKIEDKKYVVCDADGDATKTWDDFVGALPTDGARYALVDVEYESDDGRAQSKLTFVFWSPDDGQSVKDKMMYAGSKDSVKKKFTGIMKEIQANEKGDLAWESVLELMLK